MQCSKGEPHCSSFQCCGDIKLVEPLAVRVVSKISMCKTAGVRSANCMSMWPLHLTMRIGTERPQQEFEVSKKASGF